MGLDTVSGLLRIVVNGKVVVDEEKQYFKDTSAWKPKSVAGHLLGKGVKHCIISLRVLYFNTFLFSVQRIYWVLVPVQKHLLQPEHLQLGDVSGGHGHQDCWGPGL